MAEAIVARLKHVRPHGNADRLQVATTAGFQVIVGLDSKEDELGVFIPTDMQLSHEFCLANDLYNLKTRQELGLGEGPVGYFDSKRRVRSQSFRGQKSDGFWVPLSYFESFCLIDGIFLQEGKTFTEIAGVEICSRYETPATRRAGAQRLGRKQRENKCFPKHDVTKQFRFVAGAIPTGSVIYITEKLHGTSGRYGHVLDEVELSWWRRALNFVLPTRETRAYRYLNGSKNVILEKSSGPGYYGTNEFRYKAIEGLELHKGEVLYFEIVGSFIGEGNVLPTFIMPPQPVKDEVKSLRKTYGDVMNYRYGTVDGEVAAYVYRILRVNEDGVGTELSWPQVVQRAKELGLKTVPEFKPGALAYTGELEALTTLVEELTEGPSTLDSSHIREGVVLRIENEIGISYVKHKSWTFGILEGYLKSDDDVVDTEEAS